MKKANNVQELVDGQMKCIWTERWSGRSVCGALCAWCNDNRSQSSTWFANTRTYAGRVCVCADRKTRMQCNKLASFEFVFFFFVQNTENRHGQAIKVTACNAEIIECAAAATTTIILTQSWLIHSLFVYKYMYTVFMPHARARSQHSIYCAP